MKKSWAAGVCQSVCVFVQAFPGIAPERLVRSGPGWHRWTRRNAGTTVVPVAGRSAARGTWHVTPREGLPKISARPRAQSYQDGDVATSPPCPHSTSPWPHFIGRVGTDVGGARCPSGGL